MSSSTENDDQQMAFPFYEEMAPKKVAEQDFDTEDDALDALLAPAAEPEPAVPAQQPDCCCVITPENSPVKVNPLPPEDDSGVQVSFSDSDSAESVIAAVDEAEKESAAAFETDDFVRDVVRIMAETDAEMAQDAAALDGAAPKDTAEPASQEIIVPEKKSSYPPLNEQTIRRAAAGWLATLKPDGIAMKFASGAPRIKADAGAFFLSAGRKPEVTRTILVMTALDRDKCWLDASQKEDLVRMKMNMLAEKSALEEMLKTKEPDLKDDSLFPESQIWDFSRTKNRKYHACLHKIEKLEQAICHGSKFERLMFEQCAGEYYLAVPAGLLSAEELPSEWGLLSIAPDFTATVVRAAKKCECPQENQMAFALHAAAAGIDDVLFANGIAADASAAKFSPVPKRRRPYSL